MLTTFILLLRLLLLLRPMEAFSSNLQSVESLLAGNNIREALKSLYLMDSDNVDSKHSGQIPLSNNHKRRVDSQELASFTKLQHEIICEISLSHVSESLTIPRQEERVKVVDWLDNLESLVHDAEFGLELISPFSKALPDITECTNNATLLKSEVSVHFESDNMAALLLTEFARSSFVDVRGLVYRIIGAAVSNNQPALDLALARDFLCVSGGGMRQCGNLLEVFVLNFEREQHSHIVAPLVYAIASTLDDPVAVSVLLSTWLRDRQVKLADVTQQHSFHYSEDFIPFERIMSRLLKSNDRKLASKAHGLLSRMFSTHPEKPGILHAFFYSHSVDLWLLYLESLAPDVANFDSLMIILEFAERNKMAIPSSSRVFSLLYRFHLGAYGNGSVSLLNMQTLLKRCLPDEDDDLELIRIIHFVMTI